MHWTKLRRSGNKMPEMDFEQLEDRMDVDETSDDDEQDEAKNRKQLVAKLPESKIQELLQDLV